jgi:BMFP domain-containing protein YqiC
VVEPLAHSKAEFREPTMTQTSNRFFDELAKLMTDAAGVAQGVRREAETALRTQVERWIADLDLVKREDFEVVREMASKARAENERLAARVAVLEARLGGAAEVSGSQAGGSAPAKHDDVGHAPADGASP